ncbi:uncharacterized protein [Onthophagus taurus]|uniref:uncharacterized protein n=1 Tax=Onthophagus taurus TaxID=166361 RepID=UPI0039BE9029
MAIYVDDGLIISNNKEHIKYVINKLNKNFITKSWVNPNNFLGQNIKIKNNELKLQQIKLIEKITEKFKMNESKETHIPLTISDFKRSDTIIKNFPYQEAVGSLLYLAKKTRPNISFAVNFVSRFINKVTNSDVINVKRILKYLNTHKNIGIKYRLNTALKNLKLSAYCDADYANCTDTRKSTAGFVIMLNDGPISWVARKQPIVALSTTEAEYIAMLNMDNKSAISLIKSGVISRRSNG